MSNAKADKPKVFDKVLVSMVRQCIGKIDYLDVEKVNNTYIDLNNRQHNNSSKLWLIWIQKWY